MPRVVLVLAERAGSKNALNVLAGAVEGSALSRRVEVRFAAGAAAIGRAAKEAIAAGRRCVVGWSFLSARAAEAARDLDAVRAATGDAALHVAGGPHPTAAPLATLRAGFDLVVPGEGEGVLLDVLERTLAGEDARACQGVATLRAGRLVRAARAAAVRLDDYPPFSSRPGRAGPIEITRGCVHACRFCQTPMLHRARWRHRSVESAARWAGELARRGMRDVRFVTPSALSYGAEGREVRLDAVGALLEAVRAAMGNDARLFLGTFPSEVRPEHASPEALRLLRRLVDNQALLLGAQSGSDRVLAAMRRGHTAADVLGAARLAREAGFRPEVDFIVGLPGELPEDAAATRRLMQACADLGARVHGHAFMPLPGTPLAGAPPGAADAETAALLERLTSRGQGYGQWRRQAELAAKAGATT